jgi:hypothetical protein
MKLAADSTHLEAENTSEASPKTGASKLRLLTLADLDKRTSAAKRAHELIAAICSDLGGLDRLATGERQLTQRAALLGTMAEDIEARWLLGQAVDPTVLCTLANAQRRLFEQLGARRPKDVTPSISDIAAEIEAKREEEHAA